MRSSGFKLLSVSLFLFSFLPCYGQQPEQSKSLVDATDAFEFHSGFWLNLHTYLYQQAKQQERSEKSAAGSVSLPVDDKCLSQLTKEEQATWAETLGYYRKNLIQYKLLSGDKMRPIKIGLSLAENAPDLQDSEFQVDLTAALKNAAPIYRKCWWPEHDRDNREWIRGVLSLVKQHGDTLIIQVTKFYQADWPRNPIRVDVVTYAGWSGANTGFFTMNGKPISHIVITGKDPSYQSFAGFEMLFHEASHTMVNPRSGAIAEQIAKTSRAQEKPIPRQLWHAIIFYTPGNVVQRLLAEREYGDYTPYAYKNDVFVEYMSVLEQHWQPYIDGEVDLDTAISNIIKAL